MKKFASIVLCFVIFFSLLSLPQENIIYSNGSALKPDSRILNVNEAVHSKMPEVTFEVNVPQDAAEIDLSSLVLERDLSIKSGSVSFDKNTRKLKFTVIGKKITQKAYTVNGYLDTAKNKFKANLTNAMCRYSDGKRWQVNTVSQSDLKMHQVYYTSPTTKVPSDIPVDIIREVMAFSTRTLNINTTYFFDEDGKTINRSQVDPSSLEVPQGNVTAVGTTNRSKRIIFPSKGYDPKNPTIGIAFELGTGTYITQMDGRPIKPKSPSFFGGHAGCWEYFSNYVYYIKAETLPTEAYKYWGNVYFNYIPYGQAALVGELKADPSSVQYKGNDIIVDVIFEAEVINIEDPGALDSYKVYVKLADGTMLSDGNKKEPFNGKTKIKHTYKYTISKNRLSSTSVTDLTQEFEGRIIGEYKRSSYYTGELDTGLKKASTYVYKEPPIPTPTPPPPGEVNSKAPPVAIIEGMAEVKRGDYTSFNGYGSYDPDGTIEEYKWRKPGAKEPDIKLDVYDASYGMATAWYDQLGPKNVLLYVKDDDGMQAGTYHSFVVVEPTIEASINQTGTLKENRKVTFTESSNTPFKYPVVQSKTTWTIQPITSGIPSSTIKYSGTLNGKKTFDVLFKQAGDYVITLSVENTAGYTSTTQRMFTIKPDEAPVVVIDPGLTKVYRDPTNNNMATFQLRDQSYSVDGDPIVRRNWYVVYDANNDKVFNEPRVLFNTGNNSEVTYQTDKVGGYSFQLEVIEEFGQPSIDVFVTASDRRRSNSWQQ